MRNNKGFSLVELIVAFAITAIAGLAVFGLMSAGTNHFTRTGNDVGLQYEQQVVVNRLRDVLLESSDALSYDDSTKELVVYSQEDMGPTAPGALTHDYKYRVTKIYLDGTILRYVTQLYDDVADVTASGLYVSDTSDPNVGIFGEEVQDISFDLSKIDEGKIGFTISFESNGKLITSDQIVSLRNRVLNSDDPDEIFVNNMSIVPSFIQSISIKRNDAYIPAGGNTDIVKNGSETVAVPFTYEIKASEYSEYPYVGRWSLLDTSNPEFTVDSSTGIVTVGPSVPAGTTNILRVESIDDTSKYTTCQITVTDTGTYPVSMILKNDGYIDYVGYREYNIHPVVRYSDGTEATDSTLCRWEIAPVLPEGCLFDAGSNTFTALPTANGMTVVFAATLKAPKSNGDYIYATLQLPIEGVGEYIPNQMLNLSGVDSMYNCRGKSSTVLASWTNSSSTDFIYHWRISPYGESWGNDDDPQRRKFDKTVSFDGGRNVDFTSDDEGFYSAGKGYSYIYLNTEAWLDWSREYQVKVECYATDDNGKKYGIGNEVDRNYTGPVSMLVTYEPVKIILTPVSVFHQNNNSSNDKKFVVSDDLKRSSNGKKDSSGNYVRIYDPYGGNTVRTFEINARGVYYDSTHTSNVIVNSSSNVNHQYNAKFAFYSEDGSLVSNKTIKDYFKVCNYTNSEWAIGFEAQMQRTGFKTYYEGFAGNALAEDSKPTKVSVIYNAWDAHGNLVDTYYQVGENYYNDSDIENSRDHRFNIVYDVNKFGDPNYIEIIK